MAVTLIGKQIEVVAAVRGLRRGYALIVRGYAGTGKSTVIAAIVRSGDVAAILTPTGKAAARLRQLGVPAQTLHAALFRAKDSAREGSELEWEVNEHVALEVGDLVIVDEASMVSPMVADRLRELADRLDLRLVLVGDGFQLPPILSHAQEAEYPDGFSVMNGDGFPDADLIELTEVHRTALDSPITQAVTRLRHVEAAPAPPGQGAYVARIGQRDDVVDVALAAGDDSIAITWRNADRQAINRSIRERIGHTGLPVPGEPLMVLANSRGRGLYNGEVVTFEGYAWGADPWPLTSWNDDEPQGIRARVQTPRGYTLPCVMVVDFLGGQTDLRPGDLYRRRMAIPARHQEMMLCVDYGYAATGHKAQGSQYRHVVVHVPGDIQRWDDHRRWIYTAATRAVDRLTIIHGRGMARLFGARAVA